MTVTQFWKNEGELKGRMEGRIEGERGKARLMILRGRWRNAPLDFLVYQSELTITEVSDLLNGYESVYRVWEKNKSITRTNVHTPYLSEIEVQYLLELFNMQHRWA